MDMVTDMATDITAMDMVIIMDIIWVRDPPMLNQLPKLPLNLLPPLMPMPHLGTDTDTDTTVMVMDTDTTDTDTDIPMLIITANDPPNLPPKPHPHLTTDTDTTDTTVMVTDTDTMVITDMDTVTTMANNKATTPLNNATFIWLKKNKKLKFLNLAVPISLPHHDPVI